MSDLNRNKFFIIQTSKCSSFIHLNDQNVRFVFISNPQIFIKVKIRCM